MAVNIPYNDDVDMTSEDDINNQTSDTNINDNSSHEPFPSIDPIPVSDNIVRPIDNWIKDTTDTAGEPGTQYDPPEDIELTPIPEPVYRTITQKYREIIKDYSSSYLQNLHNNGAKFYVVYTDGTENEVDYTEIYDPHAIKVRTYVNEARLIAEATNQHFWHDDNGAHVTDVEQDDWKIAANSNFNDLSDSKPYHNILMNSLGILLRRALYNLVSISKGAIAFYDGLGNETANIVAAFGRNGIQIGASDRKHLYMDEDGVAVYNADGSLSTFNAENIQTDHIAIGNIQSSISDIATIRSNSQKVSDLSKSEIEATLSESRYIYISKASGTQGVSAPTNKVTETGDVQNTWTLKRPTYDPNYPVLFTSVQSVTAKGRAVFTVPVKDDTLTVIDGGHITTGTIDASRIAVDQISVGSLHDGADYVTKALALNNFQQVYISKSANTTEMSAPSVWIVADGNVQNTWTTVRPSYDVDYPKIFTSRQTRTANGTISSSTPTLDTSTTDAISVAATDATTKANNAKSDAISAAASDATTKANNAKSEAISAAATDATTKSNAVNTALESYKTATNTTLTNLQNQVDGQIEAWYENVDPTTSNDPASSWNTDVLKARHVGDLYYNVSNGHSWRWMQSGSSYTWQQIPDSDAAAALSVAQNAQNIANSKRRIFTTTPTVPYDLGDLWVSGSEVKYCSTSKTSQQTYASSDWTVTATDDTLAQAAKSVADAAATPTDVATAKNEAISAAASDATTKANNAKSEAISAAATNASTTYATKADAVEQVQIIYISKQNSVESVSGTTTWITANTNTYDTWTTVRPSYNSNYPKVFTSKQTKKNDGTITCTTPTLDTSTTDAISTANSNISSAISGLESNIANTYVTNTDASDTYAAKTDAVEEVQIIYISKDSSTSSVSANTTWVTSTTDTYNTWTTTRPSYNSSYPKVFTAKQTKKNDGTVSCTTPTLDTSTTDAISTAAADATTKANAAAKTATDYITVVDNNGIKVHASNDPGINYSRIDANGLNVFKDAVSVAKFSETTRIGKFLKGYVEIGVNANGNGYIDMYNSNVLLCHIGYDYGTDASGGTSLAPYYNLGLRKLDSVIGNYSLSEGVETTASGYSSHAEGIRTEATAPEAHAEGYETKATGTATHAEGYTSKANGFYSHAEGIKTYTVGASYGSHSEGIATSARGDGSHAEGIGQISNDGYGYTQNDVYAYTIASGVGSHAESYCTTASGDYSHAEGNQTEASGKGSHAEGAFSKASGEYSHAEGVETTVKATAPYGHAEGYQTTVSKSYSHAEGYKTTASGEASHAEGYSTTASGAYSHASGRGTTADQDYMTAVGCNSKPNITNALFVVGNGSEYNHRNAFTVISSLSGTASIYIKGSASSNGETVTSDARVKTLIDELIPETSIKFIKQLQPKHYYKEDVEEYGFYAQEVEEIPEFGNVLVTKDNSGVYDLPDYRLLNYQGMIAPIVSVEQNLISRVEKLENQNKELLEKLKAIESKLD